MSTLNQQPNQEPEKNIDYRRDGMDVQKVHGSLLREREDPKEGAEPIPLWLMTFFFIVIFWAGAYFCNYSGGFKADVFDNSLVTWGHVAGGEKKAVDPLVLGKKLFIANCAACHQATGMGQAGQFPPLVGSPYVLENETRLVNIVLHGISGSIEVLGSKFNGNMPPWGEKLSDQQVASILSYVRQEWGNKAAPITPEYVAQARDAHKDRKTPWTEADLAGIKNLPMPAATATAPTNTAAPTPTTPAPKK
jgi:mono/diheme cytochrome c family protein